MAPATLPGVGLLLSRGRNGGLMLWKPAIWDPRDQAG